MGARMTGAVLELRPKTRPRRSLGAHSARRRERVGKGAHCGTVFPARKQCPPAVVSEVPDSVCGFFRGSSCGIDFCVISVLIQIVSVVKEVGMEISLNF